MESSTMTNFEKFPRKKMLRSGPRNAPSVDDKKQASIGKKRKFPDREVEDLDNFADDAAVCISKKSKAASTVNGVSEDSDLRRVNGQMDATKKKQCGIVLRKLMTRPSSWLFKEPVDPVKWEIPDYFQVISKPMDLGTIKDKLERELYSSTFQFAADVRLTFFNAMRYNPPSNYVHIEAKELKDTFNLWWKLLESRWRKECLAAPEKSVINGAQKRVVAPKPLMQRASSCNSLTSAEKLKLQKQLEKFSRGNIPPQLLKSLPKACLRGHGNDILDVDIEKLDEKTFRELQKKLRSFADAGTTKSEGIRETQAEILKRDFRKDASCEKSSGIKKFARHSIASKLDPKKTNKGAHKGYSSAGVNGCAIDERDAVKPSPHPSGPAAIPTKEEDKLPCEEPRSIVSKAAREKQSQKLKGDFRKEEDNPPCEKQLSPRALRAEGLKKRYAVTILRAEQNTLLDHGAKRPQEWEVIDKRQREDRLRIQAKMKAEEAAAQMTAEAERKMRRERDREAARLELQKMQITPDMYENIDLFQDPKNPGYFQPVCLGLPDEMVTYKNGVEVQSRLRNPLAQLGLFLKDDDLDDNDDDCTAAGSNDDLEEGELHCP